MTIKNAIEWLKYNKESCCNENGKFLDSRAEQVAEALDMGIEALARSEEGEWVLSYPGGCLHTSHCSSCGWEETFPPLYCPGCGRKMKNPMRTTQEDEFKFELGFEEVGDSDNDDEDEAFVEALNTLLEEAVKDGSDARGSCHYNSDELKNAINAILREAGLDDKYEAIIEKGSSRWSLVKVVIKIPF